MTYVVIVMLALALLIPQGTHESCDLTSMVSMGIHFAYEPCR